MAAVIGLSFKERFWFQLLFLDFYHFHHVIWRMKWAKKLKTKNGQNVSSGPFSHDAAHMCFLSDFPILKDETELDLIGFIFANKKIMLYFTSFGNFIQIFFHLSTSQWYVSYGKKFS